MGTTGIYKIVSPSNKIYIGQSVNIEKRIKSYKVNCSPSQRALFLSIKKYGAQSHSFEIIEKCSSFELNERERYWQDFYDVLNSGLNCRLTTTNCKSGALSEETKSIISKNRSGIKPRFKDNKARLEKIRVALTGKKLTIEHRASLSRGQTGLKRSAEASAKSAESRRGIKMSKGFRDKMKRVQTGYGNSNAKIVLNIETGVFFYTVKEAAESMGWTYNRFNHYINGRTKRKLPFIIV